MLQQFADSLKFPDTVRNQSIKIPVGKEGRTLRLLVVRPRDNDRCLSAILAIHGGGFISGTPEQGIPLAMLTYLIESEPSSAELTHPFSHTLRRKASQSSRRSIDWLQMTRTRRHSTM